MQVSYRTYQGSVNETKKFFSKVSTSFFYLEKYYSMMKECVPPSKYNRRDLEMKKQR
jgi:hypothetical protein